MAKAALVEADIEAGRRVVIALDDAGFRVSAALWFYSPEQREWRLILASPEVAERGPRKAYQRIQSILAESPDRIEIQLSDVSAVGPHDALIQLLTSAVATGPGLSGIRFTGNTIGNQFIEDAYIYRLQRTGRAKSEPIADETVRTAERLLGEYWRAAADYVEAEARYIASLPTPQSVTSGQVLAFHRIDPERTSQLWSAVEGRRQRMEETLQAFLVFRETHHAHLRKVRWLK